MRIIAGTARSLPLKTIEGLETRPTTDKIKETLFNMLQNDVPGCYFLDLFAGSGQLGIEALSRGAEHCTFIDQDKGAIAIITANCRAAGVLSQARILQRESAAFAAANKGSYHVVLLDPPYQAELLEAAIAHIARHDLLTPYGMRAAEHPTCIPVHGDQQSKLTLISESLRNYVRV